MTFPNFKKFNMLKETPVIATTDTRFVMDENDYATLERLIGKLSCQLKKQICILNGHVQDGYLIAIYDDEGNLQEQHSAHSIEFAVKNFQNQKENS